MTRRSLLLLLALAAASAVLVARRGGAPPAAAAGAESRTPARAVHARAEADVDPATIRDVFRFAPTAPAREPRPVARATPEPVAVATPPPEPYRLVGLVRRQGKLLAAFSVGNDVVLAGPGDAVAGVTVVEVGEEGVRIRRPDGSESRLALP